MKPLQEAYSRRCAYTTKRLMDDGSDGSIDHFLPKTKFPRRAYDWDNYRLARQKVNQYKADTMEVVDPFKIETGWFVLNVPSCLVQPGKELNVVLKKKIDSTIDVLRLNADWLVQERCNFLVGLADGKVPMSYLDEWYPFLSSEVRRQDIEGELRVIFSRTPPAP